MRAAIVCFARNKAKFVAQTVRSILVQTSNQVDFVFSDQGSTDGTMDIIRQECQRYNGPNRIKFLHCPVTEPKGMHGGIAHLNWLHSQLDYDYWLVQTADDLCMPDRAEKTIKCLLELDRLPLFLGTNMYFANHADIEKGEITGQTAWPQESKWITPEEHLTYKVGSSAMNNWSPELLEMMGGGFPDHSLIDVFGPFVAAVNDRFYFLREGTGVYITRPDDNNMGLETLMKNAESSTKKDQINELAGYQIAANALLMVRYVEAWHAKHQRESNTMVTDTYRHFMNCSAQWAMARSKLVELNQPPIPLPGHFPTDPNRFGEESHAA